MPWFKMMKWDHPNRIAYVKLSHWPAFQDQLGPPFPTDPDRVREIRQLIQVPGGLEEWSIRPVEDRSWREI